MRYLRLSGAAFAVTVATCVSLRPGDVLTHNGLSFYGNFQTTLLPYGVGLGLTAFFLLRASQQMLPGTEMHEVRLPLMVIANALLGVVLTPSFSASRLVQGLHVLFGAVVFGTQVAVSRRLLRPGAIRSDRWLLTLQLVAFGFVLLSLGGIGELSLMLPAQALTSGAFAALLLRAVRRQTVSAHNLRLVSVSAQPPEKL